MNPTEYETALRAEIAAIRRIVAALETVDAPVQERIIRCPAAPSFRRRP